MHCYQTACYVVCSTSSAVVNHKLYKLHHCCFVLDSTDVLRVLGQHKHSNTPSPTAYATTARVAAVVDAILVALW